MLHAGGKFENDNYKVSGGLHGVGVSVVNALSEWLEVGVQRDGKIWYQRYNRGVPEAPVKTIGDTTVTGTKVRFKADYEIFETLIYNFETLDTRLKELAYLNKGLRIILTDKRKDPNVVADLKFEGGIIDFIKDIEKDNTALIKEPIYMSGEADGVVVEAVMLYNTNQRENVYSFVNNIHTIEGGTHVSGFQNCSYKSDK